VKREEDSLTESKGTRQRSGLRTLPRNVWAVSLTSFFMDISSEMVINVLPLFLSNVLGVKTNIIGLIEGVAEATASLLKLFSGWLSDKARKWLAVAGYGLSSLAKPFFYFANSWGLVAGVRWADRVGKGIRTAPRDAWPIPLTSVTGGWPLVSTGQPILAGLWWGCSSRWVRSGWRNRARRS